MEFTSCPNLDCQAQWGIEEIDFQECDACGYPNLNDEDTSNDFYDNSDDDENDDDYVFRAYHEEFSDEGDGLSLCSNCGDVYVSGGGECISCRQQTQIDNYIEPPQ